MENWGPKPFKFNNYWLRHKVLKDFVEEEWNKIHVKGRGDYVLIEKLKVLKGRISEWNREVYGWLNLNINKACKEMKFLDNEFVHFADNAPEIVVRKRSKVVEFIWIISTKEKACFVSN